jgi:hypothetical protein
VQAVAVTDLKTRDAPLEDAEGPTRAHWWILVVITGAQLMAVLDGTSHL